MNHNLETNNLITQKDQRYRTSNAFLQHNPSGMGT